MTNIGFSMAKIEAVFFTLLILISIYWTIALQDFPIETPATIRPTDSSKHNMTDPQNMTGQMCTNFLGVLIDHMIYRVIADLEDPVRLNNISNSLFELWHGRLHGLKTLQRTCPIHLEHDEIWLKANDTHPNADITIPDWMRKTGDILHLSFCLGIPKSLRLSGVMTMYVLWDRYGPENVCITLSDISIRTKLSLRLNINGTIRLQLSSMRVERLNRIQFLCDSDEDQGKPEVESKSGQSPGFISSYGTWADWLANGPLYTPLLIILEASLRDSFSSLLEQQTDW
ncbi:hypothetical protein PHET_03185 [Paragonimus heterotremus]|uniref:Uncharacterized protein n=1 Tax=Paragonimus heterotremus TaxID=100268 RepID=A0A8J4SRL0_9TREM|nr:hypothetical protein PHET_03185 [Paragonimus heterotremus]